VGLVVAVVVLVCGIGSYVTWTAGRLDRLSARVDGAWNALDAQLVRRAAAATELAAHLRRHRMVDEERALELQRSAIAARDASKADRETRENDLSRAIRTVSEEVFGGGGKAERLAEDLRAAGTKVMLARQFYNDAVRDDRSLRRRWLPRLLTVQHRAEHRRTFFEIDDSADALDVAMTREEPSRTRT
jgi:hypothetical protein